MSARAQILSLLSAQPVLTRRQLYKKLGMDIATLDWTLHDMVREGLLARPKRGHYALCENVRGREYVPSYSDLLRRCQTILGKHFSLARYALWESSQLFALAGVACEENVVVVETEKTALEIAFDLLKSELSQAVLYAPTAADMRHYAGKYTVILRRLVSQGPVQKATPYARLEKLLVDVVADRRLARTLELPNTADILRGAFETYQISPTTLIRYARRRGVGEAFYALVEENYPDMR
jgi:hypothetical protein